MRLAVLAIERAAGLSLEPLICSDEEPPVPQAGSSIAKSLLARGSGLMQRTMLWMRMRGVKY